MVEVGFRVGLRINIDGVVGIGHGREKRDGAAEGDGAACELSNTSTPGSMSSARANV